ncbi:hypothetical protein TRFO_27857 [Tritrichomonas foetus]|uniref:Uncharacterized protein n=1 Tax=Tritrichomonas foetus TaxID=1144522 RepID=A0A1J4JZK6_9EUKA|nr:hypothetical protein TRFO_27857 [Tritrichomonas foetus]|eukprot:OHT04593.1 hypothetical protein TRFO_27857 [Tritrichomonas foetus]
MDLTQTYAGGSPDPSKRSKNLQIIQREFSKYQKKLDSLKNLFDEYQRNVNEQFNNGELATRVQNIEADVQRMNELKDNFTQNLDNIIKEKEQIQNEVSKFTDAFDKLKSIKKQVKKTTTGYLNLKADFEPRIPQVDENTIRIVELDNKIDTENQATKDFLLAEIANLKKQHQDDINALRRELMEEIQKSKDATIDELQPTIEQSNSVDEKLKTLNQDLRKHISKGLKKYQDETNKARIEDIQRVQEDHQDLVNKYEVLRNDFDNAKTDEMQRDIEKNRNDINDTNEDIKNVVKTRLDNHQNRLDDHDNQLKQIHEFNDDINDRINFISADIDEHKQANNERETLIEESVKKLTESTAQRFTETTEIHNSFEKRVNKNFDANNKVHENFQEHFSVLDTHVEAQDTNLENMVEDNTKFKTDFEEFFTNFTDKLEQRIKDVELTTDAAKRTTNSRCNDLDTEIDRAKKELKGIRNDIDERLRKYENDAEQIKQTNKQENASFKNDMQKILIDIREQGDSTKLEIKEWNDEQFTLMHNKLKKMSTLLKSLKGADGTDLETLMNKINETDTQLRTNLANAVIEQEKIKKDMQTSITTITKHMNSFTEKIMTDFSTYQNANNANISDNIHDLQTQITTLKRDSKKSFDESNDLIFKNKNENEKSLKCLADKLESIQAANDRNGENINQLIEEINNEIDSTKQNIKKASDAIAINQNETLEREKILATEIEKLSKDIYDKVSKNNNKYDKELQDINGHIKIANEKFIQSKLTEENIQHSIKELDSSAQEMKRFLQGRIDDTTEQANKAVDARINVIISKIDKIQSLYDLIIGDSDIDFPKLLESLAEIQKQIDNQSDELNKSISNVHDTLLSEIHNVSSSSSTETTNIRKEIETLRSETAENMTNAIFGLRERVNNKTDTLQTSITNIANKINNFIGTEASNLPQIIAKINKIQSDFEKNETEILEESRNNDNQLKDQITLLGTQFSQYAENVAGTFKHMKNKNSGEISKVKEAIKRSDTNLRDFSSQIIKELNRISDNGGLTLPILKSQIEDLTQSTLDSFNQNTDNLRELHKKLTEQIKKLRKDISGIKDGSEDLSLNSINDQLIKLINDIMQVKSEQQTFIDSSNDKLNSHTLKTDHKIATLEDAINSFDTKLRNQIEDVKTTATSTDESNQRQFTDILQKLSLQATQTETASKKRKKKILEVIKASNEIQYKLNDDLTERQKQIENKVEENEKKHDTDVSLLNDTVTEKINQIQNASLIKVDEKTSELRDIIRKLDGEVREIKSNSDQSINAIAEFYNDEITKLKTDIARIRGSSDESLATVSQSIKKFRESSETRFKTLEDQTMSLDNLINQKALELNKSMLSGDKNIQTTLDSLTVKFQDLHKNLTDAIENIEKDNTEKFSKTEHARERTENTLSEKIDTVQKHLEATIKANESNDLSHFESINNSLKEFTKTLNNDRFKNESQLNETVKQVSDYFKNDNSAIRKLISETSDSLNKKLAKIIDNCQQKFTEIDSTTDSLAKEHSNDMSSMKVLLEDCEGRLSSLVDETLKSMKEGDQSLSHKIEMLDHNITETKKNIKNLEEKENTDFAKSQSDLLDAMNNNSSTLEQMYENIKKRIEKKKQDMRKMGNMIQLEFQQMNEDLENSKDQISKNAQIAKEEIEKASTQLRKEMNDNLNEQKITNSNLSKGIKEINQDISNRINPLFNDTNDKLNKASGRIDILDESFKNYQSKIKKDFSNIDTNFVKVENSIENTQNSLNNRLDSEKQKLLEKHSKTSSQIDDIVKDMSKQFSQISAAMIEIDDLKRVHFYNAEMEAFSVKFDEVLMYLEKNKEIIYNFIHSTFLDKSILSLKGDSLYTDAQIETKLKEKVHINKYGNKGNENEKVIKKLKNDTEIGTMIRNELMTHNSLKLIIPKSTRVIWNKTVKLLPYQRLTITGEDRESSVVQMIGIETFGGAISDPSRCFIDAFSTMLLINIRIEANIGKKINDKEQADLCALFNVRGWESVGPSVIKLSSCTVNSDRSVINVAGNAFAQISFVNGCRISNSQGDDNDSEIIYPVSAESGAFPNGYGMIACDDVILAGKAIEWDKSQYLINDLVNED